MSRKKAIDDNSTPLMTKAFNRYQDTFGAIYLTIDRFLEAVPLPRWLTKLLVATSAAGFVLGYINDTRHWNSPFLTNVISSLAVGPLGTLILVGVLERARKRIVSAEWAHVNQTAIRLIVPVAGEAVGAFLEAARVPLPQDPHFQPGRPFGAVRVDAEHWMALDAGRFGLTGGIDGLMDTTGLQPKFEALREACKVALVLLAPSDRYSVVAGTLALTANQADELAREFVSTKTLDLSGADSIAPILVRFLSAKVWDVAEQLVPDLWLQLHIPDRFGTHADARATAGRPSNW